MKTKILIQVGIILFAGIFTFISCEKPSDKSPAETVAEDDAISEFLYDDIFAEVESAMDEMEFMIYEGGKKSAVPGCKNVTIEFPGDSILWPRTITIDYGDGCPGPNQAIRKGKIIIVVNQGKFWFRGYSRTVTFDNYSVDDYKIEGTKVLTNTGKNDNGNVVFTEVLTGGKVTNPDGKELSREFERQREWVAGIATPRLRFDDEYLVTGTASGIDRKGRSYTRTIIEALQIKMNCRWIVAGTIAIQADELPEAILDYGDGECDRKATITVGEETREIVLRK
jgi:hypothetical protein